MDNTISTIAVNMNNRTSNAAIDSSWEDVVRASSETKTEMATTSALIEPVKIEQGNAVVSTDTKRELSVFQQQLTEISVLGKRVIESSATELKKTLIEKFREFAGDREAELYWNYTSVVMCGRTISITPYPAFLLVVNEIEQTDGFSVKWHGSQKHVATIKWN